MNAYEAAIQTEIDDAYKAINAHLVHCRMKSEVMTEFVRRDDKGNSFTNAPHHNRLHKAIRHCIKNGIPGIVVRWPPEYGKTQQLLSIILHIIGRQSDPEYRDEYPMWSGAYIGASQTASKKRLRTIKTVIEESKEYREVFPHLKKAIGSQALWTNEAINLERPDGISLDDPTFQATGTDGSIIGSRLNWAICDDTLTFENTRTKEQRDSAWEHFQSTIQTRMSEHGIVIVLCNSWHPNDYGYRLVEESGYASLEEPALDPATGESIWKERFSTERVHSIIQRLGPIEGPRKMLHKARDEAVMRFNPSMVKVGLERGAGMHLVNSIVTHDNSTILCGLDFAGSKRKRKTAGRSTGESCFFVWEMYKSGVKKILNIYTGRWGVKDLVLQANEIHRKFGCIFIAEDNGVQNLLIEAMELLGIALPIIPRTTNAADYDPQHGLETMGVEMLNGRIIIPCNGPLSMDPEVFSWIQELYDYIPGKHPGDRLMASYFPYSYWNTRGRMDAERKTGRSMRLVRG